MDKEAIGAEKMKRKHRGWRAMPYVIGNETFEKLGTIGTSANLLVYLTSVFNMSRISAANLIFIWRGTTDIAPLLGAFISDSFLGRYKTVGIGSIASLVGMFTIMLTSGIPKLHPPQCANGGACIGPNGWQLGFLLCGLGFMVVGAGGIRPCNLAFGADQFDPDTDSGRRGITSFFNWYYFTFTFAMMVSSTVIIYVQSDVNWTLGLAIPTVLMFFSCAFFFVGSRIYVKVRPEGSPFTSMARVVVAAVRKRGVKVPEDPRNVLFNPPLPAGSINSRLLYTDQFRFLDKAAVMTAEDELNPDGSPTDPWRLCSQQRVEEMKCLIRVIPVWSTSIIFFMALAQQSTYSVFQALQSDRHLGRTGFQIPAASFIVFSMLTLTLWIPIYDRIVVPCLTKLTGKEGGLTLLQRMGIGIVLSIAVSISSALIETQRRKYYYSRRGHGHGMPSLWLVVPCLLAGLAEAFNIIGQIEFYYKQFPENMRSVAGSLMFCGMGASYYLSSLLVSTVHKTTGGGGRRNWLAEDLNEGRLDWYYYLGAGMGVLNFLYFLCCARWYRYKGISPSLEAAEIALEEKESIIKVQMV
ncbi:putative peptide/nitrate transporter [Acorus calamus]|uniref:Peptide/nitrate transporter n=1 Tax=Acorus calamus TaxID=4465 RepID=A0AAV9CKZ8_ACOCL|nr:putative peptide/nitrate transporter [Acorus calamus]